MIEIRIPTKGALNLPPDFTLAITIPSPLWFGGDISLLPGGYSLPITIPADPENRSLLGFPEFHNIKTFTRELSAELYLGGNYYDSGTIIVQAASPQEYKLQFFFGAGHLKGLQEKSLKDIDFGSETAVTTSPAGWQTLSQGFISGFDYQFFPVAFYEDAEDGAPDYLFMGGVHVRKLLSLLFEEEGYTLEDQVFDSSSEFKRLLFVGDKLYNTTLTDPTDTQVNKKDWIPNIRAADCLKNLAKNFGFGFFIDTASKTITLKTYSALLEADVVDLTPRIRGSLSLDYSQEISLERIGWKQNNVLTTFEEERIQYQGNTIEGALTSTHENHRFPTYGNRSAAKISGPFPTSTSGPWSPGELPEGEDGTLLFYRSPYQDTSSEWYPFCSHDILDPDGVGTIGVTRLAWDGSAESLYSLRWKTWVETLQEATFCTVPLLFTWEDLYNAQELLASRIALVDPVGGSLGRYIFKELKIRITQEGIQPATQTFLKL